MYTIAQLVDNEANKRPEQIAIKHAQQTCTYKNLSNQSNRLTNYLRSEQIAPGAIIGVAASRSIETITTLVAIMKAGATYLPIDNTFPADRSNFMLKDAGVKVVITLKKFADRYRDFEKVIFIEDAFKALADFPSDCIHNALDEESIAYILYTSGSTGTPKGVAVKHSGLLNLLQSIKVSPGIDSSDIVLSSTTISFDIAELEIFLPLISGAKTVVVDTDIVKDGRALLAVAKAEKITIMQGTPFMWQTMLEAGWNEAPPLTVFCGGEAMTRELANKLVARSNQVWNMYGPTETTIYSLIKKVSANDEVITIGKPIQNTEVYLLDDQLKEVANGEVGELYIGGAGVGAGYINNPQLTAGKFIDNPIYPAKAGKIYKTGDLGKLLPNGEIQCLGRTDHQIKIRGYRVETEEVEHQLKLQKNIKNAIVVLYKDQLDNQHLVAYVVLKEGEKDDNTTLTKRLKNSLKNALPEYMIPDTFVTIPAIPLMTNGKIDRKALPEPTIEESLRNIFEAPKTEVEIALSGIFLKNIAVRRIGVNDNFLDLGIDSLVAVKIMVKVEKQFGKRLPLAALLKYPTIKQLAAAIPNYSLNAVYKSLTPIKPDGSKMPLYIVHGIGLNVFNLYQMASKMDKEQPVYGFQALGLDGTIAPLDNIKDIAEFYVAELLMHNPEGPYAVAGYSLGGYIAYEMAKQLKAMDKDVKMLAMFDTNRQYPTHQYGLVKKLCVKAKRQVNKAVFYLKSLFTSPLSTINYLGQSATKKLIILLAKLGIIKNYNPDNLPDFMQTIARKLRKALSNYVVQPYNVRLDLFKAAERLNYIDDAEFLGWKDYALGGVEIHKVPGDHKEMFNAPNDQIMADELQKRLDEITNESVDSDFLLKSKMQQSSMAGAN